ncbi:trypsin-like peptidase domain-containing protein [Streptomyces sp. P9(2023)]|uniref:VMAP-C domain-containing protein n=1 Tax=Streptomyces sp. P9(2023) TaxID=3064394 RepID=UPI0028F3E8CD|nr:trypsin-like peptidase domain-containing protein [Streptomyces sp. P9(2023)]MDT9690210.1 trypsin-like peptidase domain-containing protein [Streptomyces sp. P9(2023)]
MRGSPAWHVRVEHEGTIAGSGFLVAESTVLTCAHVVQGRDRAMVSFPGAPGLGVVPARVAERGAWAGGGTDPGDVAVLALDGPARVEPAVFAEPVEPLGDGGPDRLVAYGFPFGYDEEGAQSELRVTHDRLLIGGEWSQVEFWQAYGQEPSRGFSGAAAMRADSGDVVGMISAYDPVTRNGRMIPARVLARHLPALGELVPTPGCSAREKRWLRELVDRVGTPPRPVDRLLNAATGPLGLAPYAARSSGLWAGVWYLLTEAPPRPGRLPLAELTLRLADLVEDPDLGRELRAWSREHRSRHQGSAHGTPAARGDGPRRGDTADDGRRRRDTVGDGRRRRDTVDDGPERGATVDEGRHDHTRDGDAACGGTGARYGAGPAATPPWAPILVEIRRSGADRNAVIAEVSVYRDGDRLLVNEKPVTTAHVRAWVLDRIDEAYDEIGDGRPLIAFALPRDWLNRPVDLWTRSKGKEAPLGCNSPVVVMDHDRRGKARLQFELKRMWAELDLQDGSALHRVACSSTQRGPQLSVLLQDVRGPVGFARPPKTARDRELHGAALNAPAPIVMWPRTGCPPGGPCSGSCTGAGFLDRIAERISRLPPTELPDLVFRLRKEAFLHEGPEPHWAAELSLVWEDPRQFPEVRPMRRSPVG